MTLALGPVSGDANYAWYAPTAPTPYSVKFSIKDAFTFLGGFVVGLTGDSHQPDFTQCAIDGAIIAEEVNWILGYVHQKDYVMVVKLIIGFIQDLPGTLVSPCKAGIAEEFDLLKDWVEGLFDDVAKLLETVAKNLIMHTETLTRLVGEIEASADADNYYTVGKDVADLLVLATGPIQKASLADCITCFESEEASVFLQ